MRTEDGYIIRKCLDGESASFGLLVDKYKAGIYALAYFRLRNFHDAEDITQEAFIKAYKNLHNLRNWDNFLAWLHSITTNLCNNFIRDKAKRPDLEFVEDQSPATLCDSSIGDYRDFLYREADGEMDEVVHKALSMVPVVYQQVLTLYYLGEMSCSQIARFLGKSPTAVGKRLSRARKALREEALSLMNSSFEYQRAQRLQVSFTFRIVEAVKRIRIHPMLDAQKLPWGISLATTFMLTAIMTFAGQQIQYSLVDANAGYPLPSRMKSMKIGEMAVDIIDEAMITALSSEKKDGESIGAEIIGLPKEASLGKDGKWFRKADMPTRRHGLEACALNGKIYTIGGGTRPTNPPVKWYDLQPLVEAYDIETDTWTAKSPMSRSRMYFSAVALNGKIYAIGGCDGWEESYPTVEEYDPIVDKWTRKADMLIGRGALCTIALDNRILAIGGVAESKKAVATVEEYDPVTDTWTKKPDMPTPRHSFSVSEVNGKLYLIGGKTGSNMVDGPCLSLVEEYDPATDTWTRKADMPTARAGLCACAINDRIYVIGGMVEGKVMTSVVEAYDPSTDTWSRESEMPIRICSMSAAVVDEKVYVMGGTPEYPFNSLPLVNVYVP